MNEVCLFRETVCLESKRSLVEYINAQYKPEKNDRESYFESLFYSKGLWYDSFEFMFVNCQQV